MSAEREPSVVASGSLDPDAWLLEVTTSDEHTRDEFVADIVGPDAGTSGAILARLCLYRGAELDREVDELCGVGRLGEIEADLAAAKSTDEQRVIVRSLPVQQRVGVFALAVRRYQASLEEEL